MHSLGQDVRTAVHSLRQTPLLVVVVVSTLGLGLGATTGVYTLANWTLFRPVPGVVAPEEVGIVISGILRGPSRITSSGVSYRNMADLEAHSQSFDIAGFQSTGSVALAGGGQSPRYVPARFVTPAYLELLGVQAQVGRLFTDDEDRPPTGTSVVVISDRLWESLFGRRLEAVGAALSLNGLTFTVIGVVDASFRGTERLRNVDLWLPGRTAGLVSHTDPAYMGRAEELRRFVVRRRAGVTWAQVDAELQTLGPWLAERRPEENEKFDTAGFHLFGSIGAPPLGRASLASSLTLMMVAGGLVLLVACANVASLLLVRAHRGRRAIAVRKALGAGGGRLVRQQIVEGVMLGGLGGVVAVGLVWILARVAPPSALAGFAFGLVNEPIQIDWRVASFAMTLSLVVGVACSLTPAVRTWRVDPVVVLRSGVATATPRGMRLGAVLTAFQLATVLTLLVGALLLSSTQRHLTATPWGFDASEVTVFRVTPADLGYDEEQSAAYFEDLVQSLAALPGIQSTAIASSFPAQGTGFTVRAGPPGRPLDETDQAELVQVFSTGYFDTLGIPVLRGRVFAEGEIVSPGRDAAPVVVIARSLAERTFGSIDVVGRLLAMSGADEPRTVIGVVGDVLFDGPAVEGEPLVFLPSDYSGRSPTRAAVLVRAAPGMDMERAIRAAAVDVNGALPVLGLVALRDEVRRSRAPWELMGRLLATLAAVTGLLAGIGLYSVTTFSVDARRRELGVRVALGATPARVMALVGTQTVAVAAGAMGLGLAGAIGLVQLLESRLVGVSPFEPVVWLSSAVGLLAIACVATWIPTRRALAVDVAETLRVE